MSLEPTIEPRSAVWGQLMRAAQDGDGQAYEQLLREISPFVRALAGRHCRNRADAEEMVQETLLSIHRVRHTYDPDRPFAPWLAAIASRRIIDSLRRRLKIARHETGDLEQAELHQYETFSEAAPNKDMETVRSAEELAGLLAVLPPRQRMALEALKLREMSLAEASVASGQSVAALKVNVHRALKALRAIVADRERG